MTGIINLKAVYPDSAADIRQEALHYLHRGEDFAVHRLARVRPRRRVCKDPDKRRVLLEEWRQGLHRDAGREVRGAAVADAVVHLALVQPSRLEGQRKVPPCRVGAAGGEDARYLILGEGRLEVDGGVVLDLAKVFRLVVLGTDVRV